MPTITCPRCGKTVAFERISYIDAGKDPSAIEKVKSGEMFLTPCPGCGEDIFIDQSFLYFRPDAMLLMYYAADADAYKAAWKLLTGTDADRALDDTKLTGVRRRLVTSRESFLEKQMIFEGGLDDRLIEIMKVFVFAALKKNHPEMEADKILFDLGSDGNHYFRVLDGKETIAIRAFERPDYNEIRMHIGDRLAAFSENVPVIGAKWAAETLGAMR